MSIPARDLGPLLKPASIVIVGASSEVTRIGGRPLQLARLHAFPGPVAAVNPKYPQVQGYPCYPDVSALPFTPDLAILAVSADKVLPTLQACAARGIRAAVVFAGGFAETGTAAGTAMQQSLQDFAREHDMLVAGPNAIGLVNVPHRLYATFMTAMVETPPAAGPVAIVAQSGGAVIVVHNTLHDRGVGLRYLLNTGNEACVDFSDYLAFVAADDETRVIAGYIEGLNDGPRLLRQLAALRDRDLPIALYKVGETAAGADAAASHTARLAGSHAAFRAATRQLGALYADDMEQLAELAYLATFQARTTGRRVAILTTSGAFAAILVDKLGPGGLTVPTLGSGLQATLRQNLPAMATVANPVDITANVVNGESGFETVLDILLTTDEVDSVILFSTSNLIDRLAPAMKRACSRRNRLLAVLLTGHAHEAPALEAAGIPVFRDTDRAVRALAAWGLRAADRHTARWRPRPAPQPGGAVRPGPARGIGRGPASATADALITTALATQRDTLTEAEGKSLLAAAGLRVPGSIRAASVEAAVAAANAMGYPVVLKVVSPDIAHKTEVGGVRLSLADANAVATAFDAIMASVARLAPSARIDGVLVEQQLPAGIELLAATRVDPTFGPLLTIAAGGIATELVADASHWLLPIDHAQAQQLLRRLRTFPLLDGYRGAPRCDVDAVADTLVALGQLASDLGSSLAEIEINPLIVIPGQQGGVYAADCVVRLASQDGVAHTAREKPVCELPV